MSQLGIEFGNRMSMDTRIGGAETRETTEGLGESAAGVAGGDKTTTFGDFLSKMVNEANISQNIADQKLQEVAVGRNKDLHGAMLAMEKADINFRLLTQVRNKVIDAYREIMRMQV